MIFFCKNCQLVKAKGDFQNGEFEFNFNSFGSWTTEMTTQMSSFSTTIEPTTGYDENST